MRVQVYKVAKWMQAYTNLLIWAVQQPLEKVEEQVDLLYLIKSNQYNLSKQILREKQILVKIKLQKINLSHK